MSNQFFVRVGVLGQIGCFSSADRIDFHRNCRVICRTTRGLEIGQVLARAETNHGSHPTDGVLLRPVTPEDDLLLARLEKKKQAAFQACLDTLAEQGVSAVLMDVEHLFDGQSLYFYFLGEVPPQVESITNHLAESYEATVQFRRFAEVLAEGCGPGCGTDDAVNGCGSSCDTCAIAGSCSTGNR